MKLPKKIKAKWLKALRSGTYIQGKYTMYNPATAGFCCLGVLQHCTSGGKVEISTIDPDMFSSCPSSEFFASIGAIGAYSSSEEADLITMNDDDGKSFKAIANWIEKNIETTD